MALINFFVTGTVGRFEYHTLLINIVASMGLLTFSTLVVDQIAIRAATQFKDAKFEVKEMHPRQRERLVESILADAQVKALWGSAHDDDCTGFSVGNPIERPGN